MFLLLLLSAFATPPAYSVPPRPSCATASCHAEVKQHAHLHGPVVANGCTICHREGRGEKNLPAGHPHLAPIDKETIGATTCVVCHDDKAHTRLPFVHKPVAEKRCTECHDPHGSEHPRLLRAKTTAELCLTCHKDVKDAPHGGHAKILLEDRGCLQCHEPHFANHQKMLRAPQRELCLNCHGKDVTKTGGEILPSVLKQLEAGHAHKPAAEGKCSACHNQHGSDAARFLRKPFSPTDASLCLSCHEEGRFSFPSSSETGFRNGDKNLHYFHLHLENRPANCGTCHEIHGSAQDHLVKSNLEFHGWLVPIRYQRLPNGGSCTGSCHGEKSYDRLQAVQNGKGR
jgi:predicted CXXCH cytochrome family protein